MIIKNSTSTGDFTFGKGLSDYLTNQNATLHNVKTRLQQWKGDQRGESAAGVPGALR